MSESQLEILEEIVEEEVESAGSSSSTVDFRENAIEWLNGDKMVSVTFSQKKFINKIMKYAEEYPEEVEIFAENEDGSIFAHIPLKYFHLYRPNAGGAGNAERLAEYRKSQTG